MKIKPEQVPDEAVKAARRAWDRSAWDRSTSVQPGADVIAASINAWPGLRVSHYLTEDVITLPIPPFEETSDE